MKKFPIDSLRKISDYEWEIPKEYRPDMRVSVRIFTSKNLLEDALQDNSIQQAINVCSLPGLVDAVMVMPDMHQGYGFPIGGVAATDLDSGVISPGGIGYDINCGVRLMASNIELSEAKDWLFDLATRINQLCPSGVGVDSLFRLIKQDLMDACVRGVNWAKARGLATEEDIAFTEANGCLEGANPEKLSQRAIERGRTQLGSLGGGNHFIEVDLVDAIFDQNAAQIMGLHKNQIAVQIHTGSRGFGHQICTDYVRKMQSAVIKVWHFAARQTACVCTDSITGRARLYWGDALWCKLCVSQPSIIS